MFLGIYDYTVILTYISLGISVFGITRALEGDFKVAIFCLALSGLCDMFDGKIARTKKNREYTGGDWGAYFLQCGICHPPCVF